MAVRPSGMRALFYEGSKQNRSQNGFETGTHMTSLCRSYETVVENAIQIHVWCVVTEYSRVRQGIKLN
jgi:hypothetical protein